MIWYSFSTISDADEFRIYHIFPCNMYTAAERQMTHRLAPHVVNDMLYLPDFRVCRARMQGSANAWCTLHTALHSVLRLLPPAIFVRKLCSLLLRVLSYHMACCGARAARLQKAG